MPRLKRYLDEVEQTGTTPQDVWYDIKPIHNQSTEIVDYPTQKPLALAERIIATSTNPGDLVLDCFLGSGTTAAVAQKLGRRWIGCDINKGAIQTSVKRLRGIIAEQIDAARKANGIGRQKKLFDSDEETPNEPPKPAQFGFLTFRVNDYDLQIQHNEAVNLACEHIGVERTRTDSFFDGTRGGSLVKVIPFGHPLTPLDLEELKRELESRPDEDCPIMLVCLGCELAAKAWIDDWNRLRKGKHAINKIEAIELRTDPKYVRFLAHQPATARIKVTRKAEQLVIEVQDFISPIILERLKDQAKLLTPKSTTGARWSIASTSTPPTTTKSSTSPWPTFRSANPISSPVSTHSPRRLAKQPSRSSSLICSAKGCCHLSRLNARVDVRHERRALSPKRIGEAGRCRRRKPRNIPWAGWRSTGDAVSSRQHDRAASVRQNE